MKNTTADNKCKHWLSAEVLQARRLEQYKYTYLSFNIKHLMKNLYLKIISTFENSKNIFYDAGVTPLETIDLFDGQPFEPNNFEFTYPAMFIDYRIEWEKGSSMRKRGTLEIEAHVMTHPGAGTENFSPRLHEGLNKLVCYELIAEIMETVSTDNVQSLVMTAEEPVMTDYCCYHLLKFNTTVYRKKRKNYFPVQNVKSDIRINHETNTGSAVY